MNPYLGKNHIGYQGSNLGNHVFFGINPTNNQPFETPFYQATSEEVNLALELAQMAFEKYRLISLKKRVLFLQAIAQKVRANKDELIHWFCAESGLPKNRAETELERSCFQFEYYAKAVESGYALEIKEDSADPERKPNPKPSLLKMNVPVGPVVVFGASNFPFAYSTLGGDVASALAAGCSVIVKGHAMHPHTSSISAQFIIDVAKEYEMPEGVFSHLLAEDFTVGQQLVQDSRVKAVGFTGSIGGGMALQKLINERKEPISLYAEMGSSNPIVITKSSLEKRPEEIAQQISGSVLLNAGQFCTSPGLLFVEETANFNLFKVSIIQSFSESDLQCMLHPGISKRYFERAKEHALLVNVLYEGKKEGNFIQPSLAETTASEFCSNPQIQEEIFGSYLTIVVCRDESELKKCLETLQGQLTTSLYTETSVEIEDLIPILSAKSGRIILNGVPTGVEVSFAQQHGGPFPSSLNSYFTSVGWDAIKRFQRPVAFQNFSQEFSSEKRLFNENTFFLHFLNGKYE
ncbi:aldehyde dehydrogenase (NADP(+)) [Fluviicola taffensis]|uniref:Aldehyde dehydrogenase (NAD(+)) n=1 Tax=Fluviicola taffensis (strain DSM 16823 / NCIMB 13979 / RW262) TaxID=755732 RepID=F2ID54_FLUTR|nr:aldehyde dehydrogenase (NADP(+)) [Fluviicola taffensis]AEA44448.1 Aldehyde dehydrogenase (NAD(+)) [Fluviicola taffensis DSM 16823]